MAQSWNAARRDRIERDKAAHRARVEAARNRRRPQDDDEDDEPPQAQRRPAVARRMLFRYDRVPLALFGYFILSLWWAAGARYTIDGAPLLFNAIAEFFHSSARVSPITDPQWYLKLCWAPILISYIERRNRPWKGFAWSVVVLYATLIWLIVTGIDLGSTYLAVTMPDENAWALAQQVARIPLLSVAWSVATTFGPEIGFAALWKYMRG